MSFILQGPETADLADEIGRAAIGAMSGGGVFAFATRRGIERLLQLPSVIRLLQEGGTFDLVVGTDAITNADALLCLEENIARYGRGFRPYAFVHDLAATFHPKYCWMEHTATLRLITGSGNLTPAGLGRTNPPPQCGNWEALVSLAIDGQAAANVIGAIRRWLDDSRRQGLLLPVDDPEARSRGVANSRVKFVKPRVPVRHANVGMRPQAQALPVANNEVLVRELPRTRLGQADIGREALAFFGFHGQQKTILLQYVGLDNSLGEVLAQRLFVNQSRNYRLELNALAELGYEVGDDDSRPVLVAIKLDESAYRYTIVPVFDYRNYRSMQNILGPIRRMGAGRQMRERYMNAAQLRIEWWRAPQDLMPVVAISSEEID